jgi:hypothetical protein
VLRRPFESALSPEVEVSVEALTFHEHPKRRTRTSRFAPRLVHIAPIYFLLCHTIELLLKEYLL